MAEKPTNKVSKQHEEGVSRVDRNIEHGSNKITELDNKINRVSNTMNELDDKIKNLWAQEAALQKELDNIPWSQRHHYEQKNTDKRVAIRTQIKSLEHKQDAQEKKLGSLTLERDLSLSQLKHAQKEKNQVTDAIRMASLSSTPNNPTSSISSTKSPTTSTRANNAPAPKNDIKPKF